MGIEASVNPAAVSPESPPRLPQVHPVGLAAPLRWLAAGARDFAATHFAGAFYGAVFAAMGLTVLLIYRWQWQWAWSLIAGFFLIGPFVCSGLYWLSRARERGETTRLADSLTCWRVNPANIGWIASILAFVFIIWGRVSAVFFALISTHDFPTLDGLLGQVFSLANWPYLLVWSVVTGFFGLLAIAVGAISLPMLLDRKVDTIYALIVNVRAMLANPAPMLLWALIVVVLIGPSLAFGMVGLLVTAPLVGHGTWHAYRELVGDAPPDSPGEVAQA
ncbi:MAG: DUF2189 domain-containing protein [Burkholderiaceae bacterium]